MPEIVANHFRDRAQNSSEMAQNLFKKYVDAASPGYRYLIMNLLFNSYMQANYTVDRSNKDSMEFLESLNQTIAMISVRHIKTREVEGKTQTFIFDICDAKIVNGWKQMFDIVGADYYHFRSDEYHQIGDVLCSMYFYLNEQINAGKFPNLGIPIPSNAEFQNFMNSKP